MGINSTNGADLGAISPTEAATSFTVAEVDDGICGFLTVAAANATYVRVHAESRGCFRWVFSRNGKVTSISEAITLDPGQEWEATCTYGDTIGINCDC